MTCSSISDFEHGGRQPQAKECVWLPEAGDILGGQPARKQGPWNLKAIHKFHKTVT